MISILCCHQANLRSGWKRRILQQSLLRLCEGVKYKRKLPKIRVKVCKYKKLTVSVDSDDEGSHHESAHVIASQLEQDKSLFSSSDSEDEDLQTKSKDEEDPLDDEDPLEEGLVLDDDEILRDDESHFGSDPSDASKDPPKSPATKSPAKKKSQKPKEVEQEPPEPKEVEQEPPKPKEQEPQKPKQVEQEPPKPKEQEPHKPKEVEHEPMVPIEVDDTSDPEQVTKETASSDAEKEATPLQRKEINWDAILELLDYTEVFPPESEDPKVTTEIKEWAREVYFIDPEKPSIHDCLLYWDILWCKRQKKDLKILDPKQTQSAKRQEEDSSEREEETTSPTKKGKKAKEEEKKALSADKEQKEIQAAQKKFENNFTNLQKWLKHDYMQKPREVSFRVWDSTQRANEARLLDADRVAELRKRIGHCYNKSQSIYTFMLPYGISFGREKDLDGWLKSDRSTKKLYCLNGLTRLQFVPSELGIKSGTAVIYPWLPPNMRNFASFSTQLNTENTIPMNLIDQFRLYRRTPVADASYIVGNILKDMPKEQRLSVASIKKVQWLWLNLPNKQWEILLSWMKFHLTKLSYNWFRDFPKKLVSIVHN